MKRLCVPKSSYSISQKSNDSFICFIIIIIIIVVVIIIIIIVIIIIIIITLNFVYSFDLQKNIFCNINIKTGDY